MIVPQSQSLFDRSSAQLGSCHNVPKTWQNAHTCRPSTACSPITFRDAAQPRWRDTEAPDPTIKAVADVARAKGVGVRAIGGFSSNSLALFSARDGVFLLYIRATVDGGAEDHCAVYDAGGRTLLDNTVDPVRISDADCASRSVALHVLERWFPLASKVELRTVYRLDVDEVPMKMWMRDPSA